MSIRITLLPHKLTILLMVAIAFIALGIFVHGRVLPEQPAVNPQLDTADSRRPTQVSVQVNRAGMSSGSEITTQLKQAIERENHQAEDASTLLRQRIAQTKREIRDTQRIREQSGRLSVGLSDQPKQQAFAGKVEVLKAQLAEMQ